jgi:monoamine oxidase
MLGPSAYGKDLNEISTADFARASERDSAAFCRIGFGALLAKLAERIPVQLASPVARITWGGRGAVEVETANGKRFAAKTAIVTVSTAMLASDQIKFQPDLPRRQIDAAKRLSLGSYDRIAFELTGNPLGLQRDDLVFEKSNDARAATLLANVSGTSLCMVDVGGRFGRDLAARGEQAMVAFATDWLAGLYGNDIKSAIRRTAATQWNTTPWVMGASSVAMPGGQGARRVLAEPQAARMWFAGEATHETMWGTVNGAWDAGERAANDALRSIGAFKEPEKEKPAAPQRQQRQQQQRQQQRRQTQ